MRMRSSAATSCPMDSCNLFLPYVKANRNTTQPAIASRESPVHDGSSTDVPRASSATRARSHAAIMIGAAMDQVMKNEHTQPRKSLFLYGPVHLTMRMRAFVIGCLLRRSIRRPSLGFQRAPPTSLHRGGTTQAGLRGYRERLSIHRRRPLSGRRA